MLMTSLPRTLGAAALLAAAPAWAIDAASIAFHGSVSATAAYSDEYNYLGDTEGSPDLNIVEVFLNGSHRFENGLRASAQLYAYEVGDYHDLALDFAVLDYSFNEVIGVRAGRLKRPLGLYGDVQDIDIVRPFALLPLDFYPKTLRPILAAIDGVALYGVVSLGGAGSLDYQIAGGWLPPIDSNSPFIQASTESSLNRIAAIETDTTFSLSLFWNTPIDGLRVGYSLAANYDAVLSGPMKTAAEVALAPGNARFTPAAFPPGAYNFLLAGRPASITADSTRHIGSIEYTRGDWQFAAEYQLGLTESRTSFPAPIGAGRSETKSDSYYFMVTWQAAERLQLGAYYAESYANKDDHDGSNIVAPLPRHIAWQKDLTAAASYSLADWWLLKAEIHLLDGTRGVSATLNGDAATWQRDWSYFVLKSTISF